jgi:hypothetical protein
MPDSPAAGTIHGLPRLHHLSALDQAIIAGDVVAVLAIGGAT